MTRHPKIYFAGNRGMVGSAIVRYLLANDRPTKERALLKVNGYQVNVSVE